jgi:predicted nuclease of restriction endonuclease-like (RecB) superfamily
MDRLLIQPDDFFSKVSSLLKSARSRVVQQVNNVMVLTYFEIGKLIVLEEQKGEVKSKYGSNLINELSARLTEEFGRGFSQTNLKQMRSFYMVYENRQTPSDEFKLSWSHYTKLMRVDNEKERSFYEIEAAQNNWSVKELQRQMDSALYERLTLSLDKEKVKTLSKKGLVIERPQEAVKDPYVLDFLGLPEKSYYSENDFEQKIIDELENFLLELGRGFTFAARQKRITFDDKHFKIDLVFYNRILRSFVLIDLKIGELKHQDIGQMQMYVNYYDREVKLDEENKTIGIILCKNKSESVVKYTLPENNEQIFASKYEMILPSKEKLKELIENKEV